VFIDVNMSSAERAALRSICDYTSLFLYRLTELKQGVVRHSVN